MAPLFPPHVLAVATVVVIVIGLALMVQGTSAIRKLRIPERADDDEGFARADRLLEKGRVYLRAGEVIAVAGGVGAILTALAYAGFLPGF